MGVYYLIYITCILQRNIRYTKYVKRRTGSSNRNTTTQCNKTPNRYEGIKAVEALAAYGKEAIPKLLEVSDNTGLAEPNVKQAAKSEIDRIKKELNHDILTSQKEGL